MNTIEALIITIAFILITALSAFIVHKQSDEITSLKQQLTNCQTNR